jgi:hypothetical protein
MQSPFWLFVFADSLAGRALLRVDAARCRPAASARLSHRSLRARARHAVRHAALHMVHHFLSPLQSLTIQMSGLMMDLKLSLPSSWAMKRLGRAHR